AGWRAFDALAELLDHRFGWDKLPKWVGLLTLVGVRNVLRQRNLYDTRTIPTQDDPPAPAYDPRFTVERTADGTYNDLSDPKMGRAASRFGRNIPLDKAYPDPEPRLLEPNPRVVSRELLTR